MWKRLAAVAAAAIAAVMLVGWVGPSQWPNPTVAGTSPIYDGGGGIYWGVVATDAGGVSPGTAGQLLATNAGGTATAWATCSGDMTCSTSTPGLMTVQNISGTTPVIVTPNEIRWTSSAAPLIDQAALASTSSGSGANGANLVLTAQAGQAATGASNNGGNGGNVVATVGAGGTSGSATAGSGGYFDLANASGTLMQCGLMVGQSGSSFVACYPGNVSPSSSDYFIYSKNDGSNVGISSSAQLVFQINSITQMQVATSAPAGIQMIAAVAGGGTSPFHYASSTVTIAASGTTTLTTAQRITPKLISSTVTLTGAATLAFGGVVGTFVLDLNALSLGGQTFTISNGAGSLDLTSRLASKTLFVVDCGTTNTINAD